MNSDSLETTLRNLLQSGTTSNFALNSLLSDYTTYHVVLLIVGGLFTLILVTLSVLFWVRYKRASQAENRKWTFEKKTYFSFGLLTTIVGLLMALIVVANAGTVSNPLPGFAGVVDMLGPSQTATYGAELHQSFNTWLQSGSPQVPDFIQGKIHDRFAWQRPKAMICSVLLAGFIALSVRIWSTLIRQSKMGETKRKLNEKALLFSGVVLVPICFLLMLMVIGNTQASIAPMSLTLVFGCIG
jgi:cytochrome bd-type quinol oxidase subunit 2